MFATPGQVIGQRFEIDRHVGAGGMGVVYRAFDRERDAMAALKLVRAGDAQVAARFAREARALAELSHPSIVGYVAHGETGDGMLYLAMEWLEGEDLATRLAVSRLSIADTIAIAKQAANALAAAHARGIVHRDVKPSNLFLVDWMPERVKLLDFGIAHLSDLTSMTKTGALLGTPLYMAREQIDGTAIGARTDVFALGAVLFHCLTGRVPFPARSMPELVAMLVSPEEAPRVRSLAPEVPAEIDQLVASMLAKDPARRTEDVTAILEALERLPASAAQPPLATAQAAIVERPVVVDPSAAELVTRGRAAFAEGQFQQARTAYDAACAKQDTPEVRQALGDVLWWLGDVRGALDNNELAYAMLSKFDDPQSRGQAAFVAFMLATTYKKCFDNTTAANGWIARGARRLGDEITPLHGVMWCVQGFVTNDPKHAAELHAKALVHARKVNHRLTELIALAGLGGALVAQGEVERGLAMIDESMVEVFDAVAENFSAIVPVTCCMVMACDQVADIKRLVQWCGVADRFLAKFGSPLLFAECRAHYGSALVATGQWTDAERELLGARQATATDARIHMVATARLAELRLRQGDIPQAEELVADMQDQPAARAALAAIRHATGDHAVAAALLRRYIDSAGSQILEVSAALDLLVDACLAANDPESAAITVARLGELAKAHSATIVAAHAAYAAGRFAAATGDRVGARAALERATDLFITANAPHEAARARLALAKLLATHEASVAAVEARSAQQAFQKLGAAQDAAAAAELLRTLTPS